MITPRRVLIIVQNLPVPFDRRVWQEATTLVDYGYHVSIICPQSARHHQFYEYLNGIHIYRHPLPYEAKGIWGYLLEYSWCLVWEFMLACRVLWRHGFDVIHACNPPDTIFLIGGFFKLLFGKSFLFDHHDINPELYLAKFGRRDLFYWLVLECERLTFMTADISIATNNSYRQIAIMRGHMPPERVFVVRSGPSLERLKIMPPTLAHKHGKRYLVGYVGIIGPQEGLEYLLQAAHHLVHTLKRNDIHFAILGDGPSFNDIKRLCIDLCLTNYMSFYGLAADPLLLEVLNTADLCVSPDAVNTMNDQSTMNKIMEYMALGKPIVQFDLIEGRYSAGDAALYAKANNAVDFATQMITLIDDPVAREHMGRAGRQRVEQELSWPHEAPKLLAAYEALFALRNPAQ